ncbi:MAG: B12-binding domain-containing radical SAM protein [Candidatus Calescibacterium sp.]|nr:B12-binding domain-containing radical SAM protein [Candidatus Calescibacterium sp.]MCX7733156.1 B12-binding domain-containing radical SAM protein [bacterium]MDW8087712.1 radical SAM protein [Candidatus Calescibacterium sp.]
MRILLIKPNSSSPASFSACAPPLGLLYLVSFTRSCRKDKDQFLVLDMYVSKSTVEDIVYSFRPDLVGISCMTTEAEQMIRVSRKIKEINRSVTIVVGGPHPTGYLNETLDEESIDFVIPYEGEESFLELVESVDSGSIGKIEGVAYRKNGSVFFIPRKPIEDLDSIPPPAYDMVDLDVYTKYRSQLPFRVPEPYVLLFTSRGCPYKCIYCSTPFGKRYREHSPQRVYNEICFLYNKFNVRNFLIADDIFNLNEDRVNKILQLIISGGLKLRLFFTGGLRLDIIKNEETLYKLKKAGTVYVSFGFETSSPRLQKLIKRNLNIQRVQKNLHILNKLGIYTLSTFMLGLPGDTERETKETIKWALSSPVTNAMFFIANPLGGTELAEIAKSKIKYKSFDDFGHFISKLSVGDIPHWKLSLFQISAYFLFYFSLKRILRILRLYPFRKTYLIFDFISFIRFLLRLILNKLSR